MSTAKQQVEQILREVPDDATLEDIQYHIYVREKVESGLKDIENERVASQEEVEQRMTRWFGK